jgi:hypothetical protein
MSVLDRFIGELSLVRSRVAEDSLTNPVDKTAFTFGQAVGRLEGLRLAEDTLNRLLSDSEDDCGSRRTGTKTREKD